MPVQICTQGPKRTFKVNGTTDVPLKQVPQWALAITLEDSSRRIQPLSLEITGRLTIPEVEQFFRTRPLPSWQDDRGAAKWSIAEGTLYRSNVLAIEAGWEPDNILKPLPADFPEEGIRLVNREHPRDARSIRGGYHTDHTRFRAVASDVLKIADATWPYFGPRPPPELYYAPLQQRHTHVKDDAKESMYVPLAPRT